ncbi:alternative ribosome rescue aminoacyl-tRNA hydrolase ArfB [Albibacterium indicum]|uniref:alternative ribosome rescue aminoacyl-tRNA hydrolase ArfB n=1 Tax=Albibacterium indicum TaxID=2292082 RepID=UPI000E48EEA5|nr:alternative ribosome rescue aminoacyl-tRNA hydrolase ArfB [Pedobacter indicus]
MKFSKEDLLPFITFHTSRSGGKGGQHVNKVATKVELRFDLWRSTVFSEDEKQRIANRLTTRFQSDGLIQVISQGSRSQLQNKEQAVEQLMQLLTRAVTVQKVRRKTKPTRKSKEARLEEKRKQALKKINRRTDWD